MLGLALGLEDLEGVCLRRIVPEDHDEHGRAGAEPEEGAPAVRGVGDEREVEDGREEVPDRVGGEEDAGEDAARVVGEVFEGGGCGGADEACVCLLVGWIARC